MARTVRDAKLDSRNARRQLKPSGKPYYRALEEGLHIGYRRPKIGAGKWVARHYVGDRKYEVETLGAADDLSDPDGVAILSFKDAQALARERMVARAHAAAGKHGPLTVRDAVEDYLAFLEGNRKSASDARYRAEALIYPSIVDKKKSQTLGETEVGALTPDQLRKWHLELAQLAPRVRTKPQATQQYREIDADDDEVKRRRRSSANRTLTVLKAALNRAWREGKVDKDDAWRRVEPFESVDAARVRYLTIGEAQRLINSADPDFRPLVRAALETGARYGELCRLEVHDFNPDSGTLAIRQTKSNKPRHVVLTDDGVAFFRRHCTGRPGGDLMFKRSNGEAWAKSNQARPMALACERAKITPPIGIHTMRHTWASLSVMAGVPLMIVAKNLGHADTRMVEKHYGHMAPSYVADAIRAGAPRFGPTDSNVQPLEAVQ